MELYSRLYGDLNGKEIQKRGNTCICITDFTLLYSKNLYNIVKQLSVQFSSAAQSCPTLCDRTNHSTPGLPVHHQLPEFTQSHVHRVSDAI